MAASLDALKINSFSQYQSQYKESIDDPETFWAGVAQCFHWRKNWDKVLEYDFTTPYIKWFDGGELNISENCLDVHLDERGDQPALIFEHNDPSQAASVITYRELYTQVCKVANALKSLGIQKGDRVCIYLPMAPEAVAAMLACARIGAIHSVVFAGFSARSLSDRIHDCQAKLVITADGFQRGDKWVKLKEITDEAIKDAASVKTCLVVKHSGLHIAFNRERDQWWHELVGPQEGHCEPEVMQSEDPLFVLYTSGSTGKPKGLMHTTAGYMVYTAYTFKNVFNHNKDDIFWCTADIGWITGHSYIVYGPLLNGATNVIYEGIPTYPHNGRFWEIIDKHKVSIFYTAPTAIRALQALGTGPVEPYKLDSLRVLGSVGEPINEEAWHWYYTHIGKEKCPIVDTWWQTETGGILISPIAGITPLKPAYATLPLPGVQPVLVDEQGKETEGNSVEGILCMKFPWPGIARSIWGDHERFRQTYFSSYHGYYFTGDGARRDEQGYYRITGRVDDVLNVSGHRIGTGEVESAINQHPMVTESAVVGFPHDIKGHGIYAYVYVPGEVADVEKLYNEIKETVTQVIGALAKPDKIQLVKGLPKTRSGKIMRRILRKIAEGDVSNLGDTSTLLDPSVVESIKRDAL